MSPDHADHHMLSANWEKAREDWVIPDEKRGRMISMLSLKDGRLAIGYGNGGIDLLSIESNKTSRILPSTEVQYMDQLPDEKHCNL